MGNFSKNPDTVLQDALAKGYNKVLFQQGKPVLDRELNLLADLVSPQRLIEHHIGNGVPDGDGSDGFRITGLDVAQNDFTIKAGRCLVGGHEIVLAADTTYKTQPDTEHVASLPAGVSYVYLRVFTSEVNGALDSDLNNSGASDVGFETAVREKAEWEVLVSSVGITDPAHFLLAIIDKGTATVTDRRRTGLTMASLRDEITTARGSLASLDARLDVSLNENGMLIDGATASGNLIVNGKLGIGTATPQNKLDVEGGAVIGATYSGTNSAPTNGLLIEGNVGIGTSTPQNKLDVEGGAVIGATYSGTNTAPSNGLLVEGKVGIGTSMPQNKLDVEGGAVIGATYSGTNTAPTNGLLVEGRLGIGTATPQNKLDVEGGAVIGTTYSGTNTAPTNGLLVEGTVGIGVTPPLDRLDINGDLRIRGGNIKDSNGTQRISLPSGGNLDFKDAGGTSRITVIDNGDLQLKEDNGTAVLTIGTDGRVGINTSTKLSEFTIKGSYGWKTGTVSYTAGSVNVVGTGTSFLSTVGLGDSFYTTADGYRNVVAIADDTHLTVETAFSTTQNNVSWYVRTGLFRVDDLWETPKFFISNWGNVGIGTVTPGSDLLDVRGRCYSSGGWQTTNADYAEYFESADGSAIPVATPVVLTGEGKIRPAKKGEVPIGITAENSAVVGNSYKEWPQKYLRDKFGRKVVEKVQEEIKVPKRKKVTRERQKVKREKVTEEIVTPEIVLKNGKYIQKEKIEKKIREIEVPVFREVDLFDESGKTVIGKHRVPVMESYEEEVDELDENGRPVLKNSGAFVTMERPKLNPKYDEKKQYVPRSERSEWSCVGLLGQLPLLKGQPVASTWLKIKDLADDVELWLVK